MLPPLHTQKNEQELTSTAFQLGSVSNSKRVGNVFAYSSSLASLSCKCTARPVLSTPFLESLSYFVLEKEYQTPVGLRALQIPTSFYQKYQFYLNLKTKPSIPPLLKFEQTALLSVLNHLLHSTCLLALLDTNTAGLERMERRD